ncbi:MAG TPA: response regulator [Azospirillaceae bacterium]|nr:response regulator [Azospirillaceae bacterium]
MSKAILCVDDEPMILDSLKVQLRQELGDKYILEFAEDANDALEVLDEMDGDGVDVLVIVSDWLMPGMRGDEFLIKVHERFPQIVKVMLTGQAEEQAVERAKTLANLHCCLHKPWTTEELIGAIRSGLGE